MYIDKHSCMQVNQEEFEPAVEEEGIHSDYGSEYETAQTEVYALLQPGKVIHKLYDMYYVL